MRTAFLLLALGVLSVEAFNPYLQWHDRRPYAESDMEGYGMAPHVIPKVDYKINAISKCCVNRCGGDKDSACAEGCDTWLQHSSLNWAGTEFHSTLKNKCVKDCYAAPLAKAARLADRKPGGPTSSRFSKMMHELHPKKDMAECAKGCAKYMKCIEHTTKRSCTSYMGALKGKSLVHAECKVEADGRCKGNSGTWGPVLGGRITTKNAGECRAACEAMSVHPRRCMAWTYKEDKGYCFRLGVEATTKAVRDEATSQGKFFEGLFRSGICNDDKPKKEDPMKDKGEKNCGGAHQAPCKTQWQANDGCSKATSIAKPFNDNSCWPCGGNNQLACKFQYQDNQGCGPDDSLAKGGDADREHPIGKHHGYNKVTPNPHPAGKCWTCGGDNQPRCNNKYEENNGCMVNHSGTHHANKCWSCTRGNVKC